MHSEKSTYSSSLSETAREWLAFIEQYEAIVEGHVEEDDFTINEPIGRKDDSIIERIVREDGQNARTDVSVKGRFITTDKVFQK